jgi:hypothetical protein
LQGSKVILNNIEQAPKLRKMGLELFCSSEVIFVGAKDYAFNSSKKGLRLILLQFLLSSSIPPYSCFKNLMASPGVIWRFSNMVTIFFSSTSFSSSAHIQGKK